MISSWWCRAEGFVILSVRNLLNICKPASAPIFRRCALSDPLWRFLWLVSRNRHLRECFLDCCEDGASFGRVLLVAFAEAFGWRS